MLDDDKFHHVESAKSGLNDLFEARGEFFDDVVVKHMDDGHMQLIDQSSFVDDVVRFTDVFEGKQHNKVRVVKAVAHLRKVVEQETWAVLHDLNHVARLSE